jgi:hypothetical protein
MMVPLLPRMIGSGMLAGRPCLMQFKRPPETAKDKVPAADRSLRFNSDRRSGHRNQECLPQFEPQLRVQTTNTDQQRLIPLDCVALFMCHVWPSSDHLTFRKNTASRYDW